VCKLSVWGLKRVEVWCTVASDLNVPISLQGPTSLAWGLEAWFPSSKTGNLDHIWAWYRGPRTCWAPDSATRGPAGRRPALSPKPWLLAPFCPRPAATGNDKLARANFHLRRFRLFSGLVSVPRDSETDAAIALVTVNSRPSAMKTVLVPSSIAARKHCLGVMFRNFWS
jgi:hypothetical protein